MRLPLLFGYFDQVRESGVVIVKTTELVRADENDCDPRVELVSVADLVPLEVHIDVIA